MSKTLSDLPTDLHRLILSHDEEKLQLKKENEKLKKDNKALALGAQRGLKLIKIHLQRYDELLREEYPTCVECQDEKCIDFEDSLCHSCYHKSCKRAGDECWCACLDSDDPLKIEDSEDGDSDDEEEDEQDE